MSDARRIKRVKNMTGSLTKLLSLAPVQFKIDLTEAFFQAGFVAQDFFKVFPELIVKADPNDDGTSPLPTALSPLPKGWRIDGIQNLIPWIIAAIKELSDTITDLTKKIKNRADTVDASLAAQDTRITNLEARVAALETALANIGTTP